MTQQRNTKDIGLSTLFKIVNDDDVLYIGMHILVTERVNGLTTNARA